MTTKINNFIQSHSKKEIPAVQPGDIIRVHQKIKEASKKNDKGPKEKIQIFEGLVIARKHGKEIGATITVRATLSGVGVERIFPLHSPVIEKIEIVQKGKARRAKLYYIRTAKGKKSRLKKKEAKTADNTPSEKAKE